MVTNIQTQEIKQRDSSSSLAIPLFRLVYIWGISKKKLIFTLAAIWQNKLDIPNFIYLLVNPEVKKINSNIIRIYHAFPSIFNIRANISLHFKRYFLQAVDSTCRYNTVIGIGSVLKFFSEVAWRHIVSNLPIHSYFQSRQRQQRQYLYSIIVFDAQSMIWTST